MWEEDLADIDIFHGIGRDELGRLFSDITVRRQSVKDGRIILRQEEQYRDLIILLKGHSYAEMIDADGKVIRIEEFTAPCILAVGVLFSSRGKMPGSVIAEGDTQIVRISRNDVLKMCRRSPGFLENFLRQISDKFVFLAERLSFLSFSTIREKAVRYLLNLPEQADGSVRLPVTMEDLSRYFGVSRPALSRVFMDLEREGLLKKSGRNVMIYGRSKLV